MNKSRELVYFDCGRFPLNQNYRNGDKWYGNFLGKFWKMKGSPLFRTFRKELLNSPLEISENANWYLRSKRKCPGFSSCFYFIDTSVLLEKNTTRNSSVYDRNIFGSSSKVFRKLQKFSENVRERLSGLRIRKFSEIVKTAVIGMPIVCLYNKKNITL